MNGLLFGHKRHAPNCMNYICTCGAREVLLEAIIPFSGSDDHLERAKAAEVLIRFDGLMKKSVPQRNEAETHEGVTTS